LPVQNAPQYRGAAVASPPFEVLSSFQIERTGRQVRIVDADGSAYEGQVVEPELLASLQNASQAAGNAAATSGAATAAQDKDAGQTRGNPNAQAKAVELPSNAANNDAALNQAISPGANALSNLAVLQQADAGSGFAFQVNGLNRKLNQNVSIIGNCVTVPFQADASLNVGNQSVQSQTQAQANGNANGNMSNLQTQQQRLPAGQAQNLLANSNGNFQNTQAVQNAAFAGQFWRVTGRVQIGATNQFDLDAAAVLP